MAKEAIEAGARFEAARNATRPSQINALSPNQRRARGIIRALTDARMALERAQKAESAAQEQAEFYATQVAGLEADLEAVPEDADTDG